MIKIRVKIKPHLIGVFRLTQFGDEHQIEGEHHPTDVPEGQSKDDIVEAVVEVSVPDDGDEEAEVEEDDGGGGGGVAPDPDPLYTPGPVALNPSMVKLSWIKTLFQSG